mmetsp:Transcript_21300/g.29772  ORF Transcript_21300/g.29772 Transcript_21300/m.29772 type:complete len:592 (+) Transcript_21300:137-1912(+)
MVSPPRTIGRWESSSKARKLLCFLIFLILPGISASLSMAHGRGTRESLQQARQIVYSSKLGLLISRRRAKTLATMPFTTDQSSKPEFLPQPAELSAAKNRRRCTYEQNTIEKANRSLLDVSSFPSSLPLAAPFTIPPPPTREPYVPFGLDNLNHLPQFVAESLRADRCDFISDARSEEVVVRKGKRGETLAIPQPYRYSSNDWLYILRAMPRSRTLAGIKRVITVHVVWSLALAIFHSVVFELPAFASPALVTPALGLLLVFRTNAAYNRFWEGCKLWEQLIAKSRTLIRYASMYERHAGKERVRRISHLLSAMGIVLKQHLTQPREQETAYLERKLLDRSDVRRMRRVENRPLFISNLIAREVHSIPDSKINEGGGSSTAGYSSRERIHMLKLVDEITGVISACERIVQTPVPLNYARHTSRFLTIWCLTLPIALVANLGFSVVPVTALVVWAMFGIQEIGLMIEEPFRKSLSLHVFCNTIHNDVQETINYESDSTTDSREREENRTSAASHPASLPPAPITTTRSLSNLGQLEWAREQVKDAKAPPSSLPLPVGISQEAWDQILAATNGSYQSQKYRFEASSASRITRD